MVSKNKKDKINLILLCVVPVLAYGCAFRGVVFKKEELL